MTRDRRKTIRPAHRKGVGHVDNTSRFLEA
jgi:hypothetical protein